MFSSSTGLSSFWFLIAMFSVVGGGALLDACFFRLAACFFFCSSISLIDAAMAAFRSGSSSSSDLG